MTADKEILKRMLAEKAGYDISTPHGAERLQKDIETASGEHLSVNTIKRLAGVIPYDHEPRQSTMEILARYLGYPSLQTLKAALKGHTSGFNLPDNFIDATGLPYHAVLKLVWAPGRQILLRHEGEGKFEVEETENSKLRPGDQLRLGYVAVGYPLIVKEVKRGGNSLGEYTAAVEGGLIKVEIRDGERILPGN